MYNAKQKREYLDNKVRNEENKHFKQMMTNIFNQSEIIEENNKVDLADFDSNLIMEFYTSLNTRSLQRLLVYNSALKTYAELYGNNKSYDNLTKEEIKKCVLKQDNIISRADLLSETSILPNPSDQFICLALFEGICGKKFSELTNLTIESFDKQSNSVTVENMDGNKRILDISEELVDLADLSSRTYIYRSFLDGMWGEQEFRKGDPHIIKATRNSYHDTQTNKATRVRNRLINIQDYLGIPITMSVLLESGRINMIQNLMKEDNTDATTTISVHRKDIEWRYGRIQAINRLVESYGGHLES